MSRETLEKLDAALQQVKSSRRDLLKRLLVGGGTMALMTPLTNLLAAGKSNAAISKCFKNQLRENAPAFQIFSSKVTGDGVLTVTGDVQNKDDKDLISTFGKKCGATKVNNSVAIVPPKAGKVKPKGPKCPPGSAGKCG
jgi:hypothetical protein